MKKFAAAGKSWIEVKVEIPPSFLEPVSNYLIEEGSPGIIQEEIPRSSGRRRERLIGYFPNDPSWKETRPKIRSFLLALPRLRRGSYAIHSRVMGEGKWAEAWKSRFKPLRVTPRLIIKPPWEGFSSTRDQIVLEIEPGMAFGTGTHPTTQMCLQALEEMIPSFIHPPSVLDVGTGSGILAIASRRLGAGKVLAVDIDPVAVASARKNSLANQVREIEFRVGSLNGIRRRFDLVVANLLPQELLELGPSLAKHISSRGSLIVSGILERQKKELTSYFVSQGLEVQEVRRKKGWICMFMQTAMREENKNEAAAV